ncbi:hypothetical protein HII36_28245 [Nonomuraea sp. NN258]|uniref:hypothetical protein n=1 Tax=Nonomuraea antri TaxID=2730852 RepID=UPI0015686BD0|nr:hypothetical protein [Nonomuraea antri]NRQ35694.1 hypothetical protein [Nonomuraea antri]
MKRLATLVLLLPLVTACQGDDASTGKYSTGGDPSDSPCSRVVSAIGYAGLMLEPAGGEDRQNFENALVGRFSELRGITLEFGDRLPAALRTAVATVKETTEELAKPSTPRERQVTLLKRYRPAADQIVAGCE